MNLALRVTFATLAIGLSFMQSPANASLIARQFTIHGDNVGGTGSNPIDPFDVTVTVTWNPAVDYGDRTYGITLDSVSSPFTLGSHIAFSYDTFASILYIGGIANGTGGNLATNDFYIEIVDSAGSPSLDSFEYNYNGDLYYPDYKTKTVSFKDVPAVPEPPTLALLAFGLAMLLFLGKRRGRVRHAAA